MRKLFKAIGIVGVAIFASAGAAQAATVTSNCQVFPVTFTNGAGSDTVTCDGFNGALGTLTGVSVELLGDYQFGSSGSNDIRISWDLSLPAGVTWANSAPFGDVTGGVSSGSIVDLFDSATGGITNANFASAFDIGVSSEVITGSAATSSGAVIITYTYETPQVPEPITLSVFGAGLAGAAALRRRKKKID